MWYIVPPRLVIKRYLFLWSGYSSRSQVAVWYIDFGLLILDCDSVIQIYNHWVSLKKKDVWYTEFKWRLKSQLEFYVDPITNLRIPISLFFNPNRIQIRTEFMWIPILLQLLGHVPFLPIFSLSLSLLQTLLCFSIHWRKTHSSSKKTSAKLIAKKHPKSKSIKLNQQEHNKAKKKKETHWRKNWNPHVVTLDKDQGGRFFFFFNRR